MMIESQFSVISHTRSEKEENAEESHTDYFLGLLNLSRMKLLRAFGPNKNARGFESFEGFSHQYQRGELVRTQNLA